MRENRTYGSEGGAAQANAPFLPLSLPSPRFFLALEGEPVVSRVAV
jgi:hypothetical protein